MRSACILIFAAIMAAGSFGGCETSDPPVTENADRCLKLVESSERYSYDFGNVLTGSHEDVTLTIKGNADDGENIAGTVTIECTGFIFWDDVGEVPYSTFDYDLAYSETKDVIIRFEPVEEREYTCALDLDGDCKTFYLTGRGVSVITGTWSQLTSPIGVDLLDVYGNSLGSIWACGDSGTVLEKGPGSDPWSVETTHSFNDQKMRAIWTGTGSDIYVAGGGISPDNGMIYNHDGVEWLTFDDDYRIEYYLSIWGMSDDYIFFGGQGVGSMGFPNVKLFDSPDWSDYEIDMGMSEVTGISGTGPSDVWAVLDQAYNNLYHWNGISWSLVEEEWMDDNLKDVWVLSTGEVFIVGANGAIYRYSASQWNDDSIDGFSGTFHAVWGSSSTDVFAAGEGAAIYHFDGSNWAVQAPPDGVTEDIFGLWGDDTGRVYAVGAGGIILYFVSP